jgi:hypothetical protein
VTRTSSLIPMFVELMPPALEDGIVYVSMVYGTAVHRCACGCGEKVVTPFSPTDWKLLFDGETVSLTPSIGNWSFRCRSHYVVERNRIKWVPSWSSDLADAGKSQNHAAKEPYERGSQPPRHPEQASPENSRFRRLWRRLWS